MVGHELERTGADRIAVDHVGRACRFHLVGIFGGKNRREVHAQVGYERCFRMLQLEGHGVIVDFANSVDDLVHAHVEEVAEAGAGRQFMKRMAGVRHAIERKQHVVGIEIAAWLEPGAAVELDAFAQLEGIGHAVIRYRPRFRQGRDNFGGAQFKGDQAVVQRHRRSVESRTGGEQLRVETLRTALRAKHQGLGRKRHIGGAAQQRGDADCGGEFQFSVLWLRALWFPAVHHAISCH